MQESVQVYIIKYTHDEEHYRLWKKFTCQCDINGVIAQPQPLTCGTVFDFHADGEYRYHEYHQHKYSRYKGVAQVDRVVQPWILYRVCIDDYWLEVSHGLVLCCTFSVQYRTADCP